MRVVVIGAGQVGLAIAERLTHERHEVVVVDTDADRLGEVGRRIDVGTVHGTGCSPVVLRRAEVDRAGMVIAVTDSDEVNLLACLLAGRLAPAAVRVARVRDPEYHEDPDLFRAEPFGLRAVINPEEEAAKRLARALLTPGAMDVVPFAGGRAGLVGIRIDAGSPLVARPLAEIRPPEGARIRVAFIDRRGSLVVPSGVDTLAPADIAYFACLREDTGAVLALAGKDPSPVRTAMVYGGGNLATYLAGEFDAAGVAVKIMTGEADRCLRCAERVPRALVIRAEATDPEALREENIAEMDAFAACSERDERNVPAALLAKSLGARIAGIVTSNPTYERLAPSLGIDAAISPQSAVVGSILQFVRRGIVLAVQELWSRDAEVMELRAVEASGIVSVPLREARFPRGAMVLAVSRNGHTTIAIGETVIEPGDQVVVVAAGEAIAKVERVFAAKSGNGSR